MPGYINIGDIVVLKSHPYDYLLTNIKVSGEPLLLPPLMIVTEIFISKATTVKPEVIRYKCLWFSSKLQTFEHRWITIDDIKIVESKRDSVNPNLLQSGQQITLRSMDLELSKLKSSLTYSDNNSSVPKGDTVLNALLSYLCPTLQVLSVKKHSSNLQLKDKGTGEIIRSVSAFDVKCFWYNHIKETLSEIILPIEALKLVEEIDYGLLQKIDDAITFNNVLVFGEDTTLNLVKPKHIAFRSGYYFLRAFDYLKNENIEISISNSFDSIAYASYYSKKAPTFDVRTNPKTNAKALRKEILSCIKRAIRRGFYIRIKYKNRNDEISVRTLRNFELITHKGSIKPIKYVIGYCCLRQEERTFKLSRIQSVEELIIEF